MGYYSIHEPLTHDKLLNFVIGGRGIGKSYSFKVWAIKDFKKNKNQFAYVRRFKEEIKEVRNTFFDDIREEFPDDELKIKGSQILINNEVCGHFFSLTTAGIKKSSPYPLINKIGFDEFIIDQQHYHYLTEEPIKFKELYSTIARKRNVKVFFLSNAITITNPYFMYYKIDIKNKNKRFHHFGDILVDLPHDQEHIEEMYETRMGKIDKGTKYAEYSIENKFYKDNDTFLQKKTGKSHHYFSFKYLDRYYHIWLDAGEGKYFVSYDKDPYQQTVFSLTQSDHSPNTYLLKGRKDKFLKDFVENYKIGNVYYEDINLKNVFFEIIRLFLV